jgi:hypothetical protein
MRIADLHTGAARLNKATEVLLEAWDDTKSHWDDVNSRHFEKEQLDEIIPHIKSSLDAINRLAEVLFRAEKDCENW